MSLIIYSQHAELMAYDNSFKALNQHGIFYMSVICTRKINKVFKVMHPVTHHQLIDGVKYRR